MTTRPLRVLLIDNDPQAAGELSRKLADVKNISFGVQVASTLSEGLGLLDADRFDAVLVDLGLSDGKGIASLRGLQTAASETPVLVISSDYRETEALETVRAGAQDYLVKSRVNPEALRRILTHCIERQRAKSRTTMQYLISRVLAESEELSDATIQLLRILCESLEYDLAQAWSFDRGSSDFIPAGAWHIPSEKYAEFVALNRKLRFARGTGIPGRAWTEGQALWVPDVSEEAEFSGPERPIQAGLRSVFAFPITLATEVLGVIELFSPTAREPDDDLRTIATNIGSQIGQFLTRKTLEAQKQRMEVELRHAQKLEAVGSLAAGIAHEINTPIQFIGDNTRFLQDSFRGRTELMNKYEEVCEAARQGPVPAKLFHEAAEIREKIDWDYLRVEVPKAMEQMLDGIGRVAKIVRAMKEFSHVDRTSQKAAADLNKALASTLVVASSELKYVADVDEDYGELPPVLCHLGDLNQVFLNLLINAAHAIDDVMKKTGDKGTISVRTRQDGDWVELSISDTGGGIPDSVRGKIFDPFFTTKEVGKGTGQGLTLARAMVVEKHGGILTFETETGKGTTFRVRLPINGVPEPQQAVVAK
jgi:signal transduction histidine kinase/DNA-binding response OmpR family regulator